MFNKKALALLAALSVPIVSFFYYFIKYKPDRLEGWETEKSAQQPFKPGAILNGQPPADLQISLIEPKAQSPISVKPASSCEFQVSIKLSNTNSPDSDIPPTFVFLKIHKLPKHDSKLYDYVFFDNKETSPDTVQAPDSEIRGSLTASVSAGKPLKGDGPFSSVTLSPLSKTGHAYVYAGQVVAPRNVGDYAVVLEAEYAVFDVSRAKATGILKPQQYRKSTQGAILRVAN